MIIIIIIDHANKRYMYNPGSLLGNEMLKLSGEVQTDHRISASLFVWFYGISTLVGYFKPNLFLYKKQLWFKHHPVVPSARISLTLSLSPPLPIFHRFLQVFRATPRVCTELLYVGSSWSPCLCTSMWRGPQEYITHELVPTSLAVSHMSGSSNLDSFQDGR